jgi:23S rRNA (uridine2552-2'-O)-methyltransferase
MERNPYRKPDRFTVAAKKAGYPARSVFKLEEIDRRVRLLRPGMHVLDLGAAPGAWALYASKKIGHHGRLLALDLQPFAQALPANVEVVMADVFTVADETLGKLGPYDVVMSDMAPNTTGVRLGDQTRSFELFMRAVSIAEHTLKPGGMFVGKIFMGEDLPIARAKVRSLFEKERLIRPETTRATSYEVFVVGETRLAHESGP